MQAIRMTRSRFLSVFIVAAAVVAGGTTNPGRAFALVGQDATDSSGHKDARTAVIVMGLQVDANAPNGIQGEFENMLRTELSRRRRLRIVAREALPAAVREIKLGDDGLIDPKQRRELGGITAAEFLIFPRLTKYEMQETTSDSDRKSGTRTYTAAVNVGLKVVSIKTNVENMVLLNGNGSINVDQSGKASATLLNLFSKNGTPGRSSADEVALENAMSGAGKKVLEAVGQDGSAEQYTVIDINKQDQTLMIDAGKGQGISENLQFKLYNMTKRVLSSGKEHTFKKEIGVARVIHVDDDTAQLQPGEWKTEGPFYSRHQVWHPDPTVMETVTDKSVAILTDDDTGM